MNVTKGAFLFKAPRCSRIPNVFAMSKIKTEIMAMTSWVETKVPPGWAVSRLERNHARPDRLWWARTVGCACYSITREAACRAAWERWAIGVLGDRLRWVNSEVKCDAPWLEVTGCNHPTRGEIECSAHYLSASGIAGWDITVQWEPVDESDPIGDPVEALARLAAMSLSLLGPESTSTIERSV